MVASVTFLGDNMVGVNWAGTDMLLLVLMLEADICITEFKPNGSSSFSVIFLTEDDGFGLWVVVKKSPNGSSSSRCCTEWKPPNVSLLSATDDVIVEGLLQIVGDKGVVGINGLKLVAVDGDFKICSGSTLKSNKSIDCCWLWWNEVERGLVVPEDMVEECGGEDDISKMAESLNRRLEKATVFDRFMFVFKVGLPLEDTFVCMFMLLIAPGGELIVLVVFLDGDKGEEGGKGWPVKSTEGKLLVWFGDNGEVGVLGKLLLDKWGKYLERDDSPNKEDLFSDVGVVGY